MAGNERFDDSIGRWLEEAAPNRLPQRVLEATFERTRRTRQESAWRIVPGWLHMPRFVPAVGGAAILVASAVLAVNLMLLVGPGATPTSPPVFTQIAPDSMVEMPEWPLTERTTPPMVWTGTELLVWGDGIYGGAADGAAFNLAEGSWRVLAEAPLGARSEPAVAWTGTEMLVWGGRIDNTFFYDGAAYNPATDTWRQLTSQGGFDARAPFMVWTGTEAVVLGQNAAAYDPARNRWRVLASPPSHVLAPPVWTGDSIVVPGGDEALRYDLATDRWTRIDIGASATIVVVPGSDGRATTFVNLPSQRGAPVRLIDGSGGIDGAGRLIRELPPFPGDPGVFGDKIGASGVWVGSDAVFEIWRDASDYEPEQLWALNVGAQTWRRIDGGAGFPRIDRHAVTVGDLLLLWNRPGDQYQGPPYTPRVCCVAPSSRGGSIYRIGSTSVSEAP